MSTPFYVLEQSFNTWLDLVTQGSNKSIRGEANSVESYSNSRSKKCYLEGLGDLPALLEDGRLEEWIGSNCELINPSQWLSDRILCNLNYFSSLPFSYELPEEVACSMEALSCNTPMRINRKSSEELREDWVQKWCLPATVDRWGKRIPETLERALDAFGGPLEEGTREALLDEVRDEVDLYDGMRARIDNAGSDAEKTRLALEAYERMLPIWIIRQELCADTRIEPNLYGCSFFDQPFAEGSPLQSLVDELCKSFCEEGFDPATIERYRGLTEGSLRICQNTYSGEMHVDQNSARELYLASIEGDGKLFTPPRWVASKADAIWNLVVCPLFGPALAKPEQDPEFEETVTETSIAVVTPEPDRLTSGASVVLKRLDVPDAAPLLFVLEGASPAVVFGRENSTVTLSWKDAERELSDELTDDFRAGSGSPIGTEELEERIEHHLNRALDKGMEKMRADEAICMFDGIKQRVLGDGNAPTPLDKALGQYLASCFGVDGTGEIDKSKTKIDLEEVLEAAREPYLDQARRNDQVDLGTMATNGEIEMWVEELFDGGGLDSAFNELARHHLEEYFEKQPAKAPYKPLVESVLGEIEKTSSGLSHKSRNSYWSLERSIDEVISKTFEILEEEEQNRFVSIGGGSSDEGTCVNSRRHFALVFGEENEEGSRPVLMKDLGSHNGTIVIRQWRTSDAGNAKADAKKCQAAVFAFEGNFGNNKEAKEGQLRANAEAILGEQQVKVEFVPQGESVQAQRGDVLVFGTTRMQIQ